MRKKALNELCEEVYVLSDRLDNIVHAMILPMPSNIHLDILKTSLPELRDELRLVLAKYGYEP